MGGSGCVVFFCLRLCRQSHTHTHHVIRTPLTAETMGWGERVPREKRREGRHAFSEIGL